VDLCGGCCAEEPESGIGVRGADFENALWALFLHEEFEEAACRGGDVEHLLCAVGGGGIVAGAMAMDVGQQIIKLRIGEYVWVHVGIEVTGLGKVEG